MTVVVPAATGTSDGPRKPEETPGFRPDIQGLRAIAVAMVVIYHLYPSALPGGFAGVDVFFVISGYLITGHLWRGYAQTGKVGLADFWGRRARRLVPAAALVAVVPVALAAVYLTAEPAPWNGTLGPNYPGAAALAGAVTNVPVAPILKPPDPISQTLDQTGGCLDDFGASTPKECVFGDTAHAVLTVALVGDSAAGQWFDALNAIAVRRHWKLVTELHSSCPWSSTLVLNWNGIGDLTACQAWGTAVLHDLITTIRPNVVITTDYPSLLSTPGLSSLCRTGRGAA